MDQQYLTHSLVMVAPYPLPLGNYEMDFDSYLAYASHQQDEMPLYLFDKTFCKGDAKRHLADDFKVPEYFAEDLFSVLGEGQRPDYRWVGSRS